MFKKIKNGIRRRYFDFQPYKKKMDIKGIDAWFFYATEQAREWYDPLKPYALLEYEWVLRNVRLQGQRIADCGSHHGQYSVVFAAGAKGDCQLLAVDPMPMNCTLTEVNLLLNGLHGRIEQCAITTKETDIRFSNQSNGFISESGGMVVKGRKLSALMPDAQVVKLDIEGHEFAMLQQALDELPSVHTWIIEVHPTATDDPNKLAQWLLDKGYRLDWVNREKNIVEPYQMGTKWAIHTTIFARK
ncbi:MAG: FkbM family methyltransferase [Saprospiraceae bacterium]|jgi:FkbM family methyltransferase|nr:FkbM family methyltransferase [Saprospiraceae bacterium]